VHKGHSHVPYGMAVRGGRKQSRCHPGSQALKVIIGNLNV